MDRDLTDCMRTEDTLVLYLGDQVFRVNRRYFLFWCSPLAANSVIAHFSDGPTEAFPTELSLPTIKPAHFRIFLSVINATANVSSPQQLRDLVNVVIEIGCIPLATAVAVACIQCASTAHCDDLIAIFNIFDGLQSIIGPCALQFPSDHHLQQQPSVSQLSFDHLFQGLLYRCSKPVLNSVFCRDPTRMIYFHPNLSTPFHDRLLDEIMCLDEVAFRSMLRSSYELIVQCVRAELMVPLGLHTSDTTTSPSTSRPVNESPLNCMPCDIELCLPDSLCPANKSCLISLSPVFNAMMCGPYREAGQNRYDLPDDNLQVLGRTFIALLSPTFYGCWWRVTPTSNMVSFSPSNLYRAFYFVSVNDTNQTAEELLEYIERNQHEAFDAVQDNMAVLLELADKYAIPSLIRFSEGALKGSGGMDMDKKCNLARIFSCATELSGYCESVMTVRNRVDMLKAKGKIPWWCSKK